MKKENEVTNNVCPYDEPLHDHHDGCPACYMADRYNNMSPEEAEAIAINSFDV